MGNKQIFIVELNGEKYEAEPTLGAMLLFKKETGKEASQIDTLSDSIVWFWCCVKSTSSRTGKRFDMECQEFADSCTMDVLNAWVTMQRGEEGESKKKTVSRKASASS